MILIVRLTFMLSRGYMAPEYLYRGEISTRSDIYSLGVVIMEITTGEKNFSGKQDMSARDFVDKARPRLENIFLHS